MDDNQNSSQTRRKVFILAGLMDMLFGAALLLIWVGILPVDLSAYDIPHWVAGAVGALLFFPGLAVVTYQLTKPGQLD